MKKGIIIFILLAIVSGFLFMECEQRAGNYEAEPIGTQQRSITLDGFTLPLKHIVLAEGSRGLEPVFLENQGFVSYMSDQWLCQLSPTASQIPIFEQPGHELALRLKMDGARNTIAYLQEQGYSPSYFFSYHNELYLVALRSGREYVMPVNEISSITHDLYRMFTRPVGLGDFLAATRSFVQEETPSSARYGLIF